MKDEDQAMETPQEELMESDLNHYEHLSKEVGSWTNSIPRAIKFYYEGKPKLEATIADYHEKMCDILDNHIEPEVRGEARQFFDIVKDQLAKDKERIAKMKELFDPFNLLEL